MIGFGGYTAAAAAAERPLQYQKECARNCRGEKQQLYNVYVFKQIITKINTGRFEKFGDQQDHNVRYDVVY